MGRKRGPSAANEPAKPASPAAPAARLMPPERGVKVRMYRTGLGDCFLLAFPRAGKAGERDAFYLLIDCGVYFRTPAEQNAPRIRRIVEHIRDATAGRLDLLVITHEHWDHVSAFHHSQAQDVFKEQIALGRLWLAWTENLALPLARDLHEGRKAARLALGEALERMHGLSAGAPGAAGNHETRELIGKVLDFFGDSVAPNEAAAGEAAFGAKKSTQTEEAMTWVREEYGKDRARFLHPGDGPVTLEGVADARVYILGPPEDPTLIRRDKPQGDEVYPRAMAAAIEASFFAAFGVVPAHSGVIPDLDAIKEARTMSLPFDEALQIKADDARQEPFFKDHYYDNEAWRHIEGDWLEAAGEFALQLDNATNNTSLAFALEIGPPGEGKVLLFPGDAQVGNWLSWFGKVPLGKQELGKDMVWMVGDRKITAVDLLRRTVLYKVGHHGSHNATLTKQGLELMGRPDGSGEFVAMLPVDEHVARQLAHYGEMPLRSLMKELSIRTAGRVARNDEGDEPDGQDSTLQPIPGAPPLSSTFVDEKTDLYFEYTVVPPK